MLSHALLDFWYFSKFSFKFCNSFSSFQLCLCNFILTTMSFARTSIASATLIISSTFLVSSTILSKGPSPPNKFFTTWENVPPPKSSSAFFNLSTPSATAVNLSAGMFRQSLICLVCASVLAVFKLLILSRISPILFPIWLITPSIVVPMSLTNSLSPSKAFYCLSKRFKHFTDWFKCW